MTAPFAYNLFAEKLFNRIAKQYTGDWGVVLVACDCEGKTIYCSRKSFRPDTQFARAFAHAVNESLRWGQPTIYDQPEGYVIWGIALTQNAIAVGGLVAVIKYDKVFDAEKGTVKMDIVAACTQLRQLAEKHNLTNAWLLAAKRDEYSRQQKRAEIIHEMKKISGRDVIEFYLRQEPLLLSTIRRGDRSKAIEIVNSILTALYFQAGDNVQAIKSLVMELTTAMCRTAIEAGGEPTELLGSNYAIFAQLAEIDQEEDLAHWVVGMINRFMDSIEQNANTNSPALLQEGIDFIYANYDKPITRDDAAAASHLSGSHFSKVLKEEKGLTFTDLLNRVRVDQAARLLRNTDKSLIQISLETGFADQSYFTKVFRKAIGKTPKEFRQKTK